MVLMWENLHKKLVASTQVQTEKEILWGNSCGALRDRNCLFVIRTELVAVEEHTWCDLAGELSH